jgi:hypothetical protein
MACYSGFLVSLTLHLQGPLGFSALHAGVVFAVYAAGFATASLSWPKLAGVSRTRLVVLGPLLMATALLGVGLFGRHGGWPVAATTPLLFAGGVGHAWGFSPLATRLTTLVDRSRASDLSGLILTADFTGTVFGVASFAGVYLSGAAHNSARSLFRTTALLAATLMITAACAAWALRPVTQNPEAAPRPNAPCH